MEDAKKQARADKKATEKAEKTDKKVGAAPKKSSSKDDKGQTEEKEIEPNLEYLWQLKDMGFPEDLGKRALIKVKNESVAAAVEAVVAL